MIWDLLEEDTCSTYKFTDCIINCISYIDNDKYLIIGVRE